mmetsp:Transcript_963/g.2210  ORF Transcript_963/g.2210 Transcript_963/m.2210 type:complete len:187 (-) Transcript_963:393-953(-)
MGRGRPVTRAVRALVDGGAMTAPRWLSAVEAVPPRQEAAAKKPAAIVYPEDRLRRRFAERYPEARRLPVRLNAVGGECHVGDRFVRRQMGLMETGMAEGAAFAKVEEELNLHPDAPESLVELDRDMQAGVVAERESIFAPLLADHGAKEPVRQRVFEASMEEVRRDEHLLSRLDNSGGAKSGPGHA